MPSAYSRCQECGHEFEFDLSQESSGIMTYLRHMKDKHPDVFAALRKSNDLPAKLALAIIAVEKGLTG